MKHLEQQEWVMQLNNSNNAIIIDVRTPQEWSEGIIENALMVNIFDQETFMDTFSKLEKSKSYFVYCRSGARSGQACQILSEMGVENAFNLMGGILNWSGNIVAPTK